MLLEFLGQNEVVDSPAVVFGPGLPHVRVPRVRFDPQTKCIKVKRVLQSKENNMMRRVYWPCAHIFDIQVFFKSGGLRKKNCDTNPEVGGGQNGK